VADTVESLRAERALLIERVEHLERDLTATVHTMSEARSQEGEAHMLDKRRLWDELSAERGRTWSAWQELEMVYPLFLTECERTRHYEAERDALKIEIEGLSLDLAQEQAEHQATQRVLAKVRAARDEAVGAAAASRSALERVGGLAHAARRYLAGQEDSRGPIAWAAEALDAAAEVVVEPTPSFPCAECGTPTAPRVVPVCPSCGEVYLSPRALAEEPTTRADDDASYDRAELLIALEQALEASEHLSDESEAGRQQAGAVLKAARTVAVEVRRGIEAKAEPERVGLQRELQWAEDQRIRDQIGGEPEDYTPEERRRYGIEKPEPRPSPQPTCERQDSDDEGRGGYCGKPAVLRWVHNCGDPTCTVLLCQDCADENPMARGRIEPLSSAGFFGACADAPVGDE
jgi:hypothetical protein